jgi:hypothetical protein
MPTLCGKVKSALNRYQMFARISNECSDLNSLIVDRIDTVNTQTDTDKHKDRAFAPGGLHMSSW